MSKSTQDRPPTSYAAADANGVVLQPVVQRIQVPAKFSVPFGTSETLKREHERSFEPLISCEEAAPLTETILMTDHEKLILPTYHLRRKERERLQEFAMEYEDHDG